MQSHVYEFVLLPLFETFPYIRDIYSYNGGCCGSAVDAAFVSPAPHQADKLKQIQQIQQQ